MDLHIILCVRISSYVRWFVLICFASLSLFSIPLFYSVFPGHALCCGSFKCKLRYYLDKMFETAGNNTFSRFLFSKDQD